MRGYVKFLGGDLIMTDSKSNSLRGLVLEVLEKLTDDGIIRKDDNIDMEKFSDLVRRAYYSTLPPPHYDEIAHLIADKLWTVRKSN